MGAPGPQDLFPNSPAWRGLQPLRIPAGWTIGWNQIDRAMEADRNGIGGSSLFNATNPGRRFNLDIAFRPEFDPAGAFHLTVTYQPWPRSEGGRRNRTEPFRLGADAEVVHEFGTRSYADLIRELEHWIARCTVWEREGG